MDWPSSRLVGLVLLVLSSWTVAVDISYCSPDNNAQFGPVSDIWQSNGACLKTCRGQYAVAILQGNLCWCSNYVPGNTVNSGSCNSQCPGYPADWCGNPNQGLYGYYAVDGAIPSGTSGASSASSRSSSASTFSFSSSSSSSSSPSPSVSSSASSSPSPSPSSSSPSSTPSSSNSPTAAIPTQVLTSITTVTGQIRTILVTPTSTTDSALGGATTPNASSGGRGGISGGTVAGIVVGVAIGLGILVGLGVWFWLRRKHQRRSYTASEGGNFASPSAGSSGANNSVPSRQVSQMSSAGLLMKHPRVVQTRGLPGGDDPRSAATTNSNADRQSVGVDQRLNPWAIYSNEDSRASNVSLQDNQDYSRQLRVANPDP